MTFSATLETNNGIAKITLSGELDRKVSSVFQEQVEKAAAQGVHALVLLMQDLEYMASAGLRVLIFAKQQMGANVTLYVVGAQEMVVDTIEKTGFDQSVVMLPEYDPAIIEKT
jgi:anti-anti-sigma factor